MKQILSLLNVLGRIYQLDAKSKPNLSNWEEILSLQSQLWPINRKPLFLERGDECSAHKMSFLEHIIEKFQRPTILELNIEGLIDSEMMVLQHLAEKLKALAKTQQAIVQSLCSLYSIRFLKGPRRTHYRSTNSC